ncbi:high affinity cationic amino acid transporter 1 domain protein, partial [Opisthorchis viverrini]
FPVNAEFLGEYPDFLGALLIIALGLILCRGPKLSAMLNTVVTLLNLTVIILATIIMLAKPQQVGSEFAPAKQGGFFPFGFGGMIGGAGTCFYAFIGFDAITVSSEEALNPKRSMPIATAVSVTVVTLLFLLASLGLTLFVPWWTVDRQAAFTAAFHVRNVEWATYVTGIGSLLGLSASLFTSMYAMPRIGYAMAADGLLPKWIGYVMPSTQVPIVALWLFGVFAAILTFLCDIHLLADFLSIGTLIAYTIVAVNVCILRYTQPMLYSSGWNELDKSDGADIMEAENSDIHETNEAQLNEWPHAIGRLKSAFRHLPILRDSQPGRAPIIALLLFIICAAALASLVLPGARVLEEGHWWAVLLLIIFIVGALFFVGVMFLHEQNKAFDSFKVPFVPFIPCLCIFLNFCLIVKLSPMTWIRFIVWLLIGLMIYFAYGWRHSIHATDSGEKGRLIPNNDDTTEPTMVESSGVLSRPKETNNVTYEFILVLHLRCSSRDDSLCLSNHSHERIDGVDIRNGFSHHNSRFKNVQIDQKANPHLFLQLVRLDGSHEISDQVQNEETMTSFLSGYYKRGVVRKSPDAMRKMFKDDNINTDDSAVGHFATTTTYVRKKRAIRYEWSEFGRRARTPPMMIDRIKAGKVELRALRSFSRQAKQLATLRPKPAHTKSAASKLSATLVDLFGYEVSTVRRRLALHLGPFETFVVAGLCSRGEDKASEFRSGRDRDTEKASLQNAVEENKLDN